MSKMSKIDQIHIRAVMLCMSKTSKMGKEHTHTFWLITSLILNGFSIRKKFWKAETENFPTIPSNSMYVEACRSMSKIDQIHIRAVMLCMSKMSKMGKEHTHTFWLITSLILNGFSIRKKFWKAETENFPTIPSNSMYVEACRSMSKIDQIHIRAVMLCMSKMSKMGKEHTHTFWLITSLILNGFSIRKKFWKAETESFPTIPSNSMYVEACRRCRR